MTTVFVSNLERVVGAGRVTDSTARKVLEVSQRFVWYPYDVVVLPQRPDASFVRYAASLGAAPKIATPKGIDPANLSILDGFVDVGLRRLISGTIVESYIRDPDMYAKVHQAGGDYLGGDPRGTTNAANNKGRYHQYADGIVHTPTGKLLRGSTAIATEVMRLLVAQQNVFVRLTNSGGGIGNRTFNPAKHGKLSKGQIIKMLEGDMPKAWQDGSALVEIRVPDLRWSPGVAFHTEGSVGYDFLQVTQEGNFTGGWSPVPVQICQPSTLAAIGGQFAQRLRQEGFYGWADTDLGVCADGSLYGFEINGRMDGLRHGIEVVQKLHGPWSTWRSKRVVMKSMDHVVLKGIMSFAELYARLNAAGLLATRSNPCGVIITIPPTTNIAGLLMLGHGYRRVAEMYQRTLAVVGKPGANREDHPLFRI